MAKFNGKDFLIEISGDIKDSFMNGSVRTELNHYTNLDSLLEIMNTKTLKLNSIKLLNDKLESKYIKQGDLDDLVFVSSFSHGAESIPLWHIYTQKEEGINISFEFKQSTNGIVDSLYDDSRLIVGWNNDINAFMEFNSVDKILSNQNSNWKVDIKCSDVKYDINGLDPQKLYIFGDKYNLNAMGVYKSDAWHYEEETRVLAIFRTHKDSVEMPKVDFLLLPITFEKLNKMVITFSPWMADAKKDKIKNTLLSRIKECKIEFKDSCFTGIIERK